MQKPNCKCMACNKEYYFCLQCNKREPRPLPRWHVNFCDETCMNVFETVSSYCAGSLTKEEANEIIGQLDSSKFDSLKEDIQAKIKEIQKKDKPAKPSFSDKRENSSKGLVDSKEESKGLMEPSKEEKGTE